MGGDCSYLDTLKSVRCPRPARRQSDFCVFHEPDPARQVSTARFVKLLAVLDRNQDGNWRGFVFPRHFSTSTKDITKSDIDLSFSNLGNFSLNNVTFAGKVRADNLVVSGDFISSAHFNWVRARNVEFQRTTRIGGSCSTSADFNSCVFHGPVYVHGNWEGEFSLQGSRFLDFVEIRGGWNIYASVGAAKQKPPTRNPLFRGQVTLQDIKFSHPSRVRFFSVSLEKTLFVGTDLIGAQFYDVIWPKFKDGRLGLYDEIHMLTSSDPTYRVRDLSKLEAAYRNCRLALERNHDYSTATDFYVGEMNVRQIRRKNGQLGKNFIEDVYRVLSNYGASPARAFGILLAFTAIHFGLNQLLICSATEFTCSWMPSLSHFLDQAAGSVRVVTLQRLLSGPSDDIPGQSLLDSVFAGLAPVQIALVVLAIRSRIRR